MADSFPQQITALDWKHSDPVHALLCLPAVALPLIVGLPLGYRGTAVLMAGGAMTVGFGSYQQPLFGRSGAMIAATVGIAISALAGALCRDSSIALIATVAVWAFIYGMSNAISAATAWVGQQCCVFLVISSAAPSTPGTTHDLVLSALLRGAGVLAGGTLQTLLLMAFLRLTPRAQSAFTDPDFDPTRFRRSFLLEQLRPRSGNMQFTIRMVLTGVAAVALYRTQTWTSAYWIGMTAMLVPKPNFTQTMARGLLRAGGTIAGALLCTAVVVWLRPGGPWLVALTLLFLFGTYALNTVNYGAFAVTLTGYICFILAIANEPPREVLQHRVLATVIGSALVTGMYLLFAAARKIYGWAPPIFQSLER